MTAETFLLLNYTLLILGTIYEIIRLSIQLHNKLREKKEGKINYENHHNH